jgi:CheY-like chemotaxis protein
MIKVLVVEDEPEIQEVLIDTFARVGYKTYGAFNAKEAMEIFLREKPDAVFLDILLPDKDGLDVLKDMKALDKNNIVVMVSSRVDPQTIEAAKKAGAVEFVQKPFFRETLRKALAHNLNRLPKARMKEKPKILIVDDEQDICTTLSRHLKKRLEADIVITFDGDQAYDLIMKNKFDVVFMDIKLPGMDGLTIIEKVKKKFKNTHFLVITGYTGEDFLKKAKGLGITEYFHKPVQIKEIYKKIEEILTAKNKCILK